ncbi:MAG: diguanylate cyclase (GGDEF)-like protein [Desulforhopalus sp.]|jgi:diguanylate cyclase (GGDEF)-like protein
MEKIPVLILCNPEGTLGKLVVKVIDNEPGAELVWARDARSVETQFQGRDYAFVIIDFTAKGLGYLGTTECVRELARQETSPLLFLVDGVETGDSLCRDYGSGLVDCLPLPVPVNILTGKTRLFFELYRLKKRVASQTTDFDAKMLELEVLQQELKENKHRLELFSSLDNITGLFNRYYFDENLQKEWRQAVRENEPLSLLFIDVDYLKAYNEYYGYVEGDDCLRALAGSLHRTLLRPVDIVARYGGDQFAAILPNTNKDGAGLVAKRMMETVSSLNRKNEASPLTGAVTISIGGATILPSAKEKVQILIAKAQQALGEAKTAGRNRICHL